MELPEQKIHFLGFLANTDSSILKVSLNHGFETRDMSLGESVGLVSTLETLPSEQAMRKLVIDFPCVCLGEEKCYLVSNSVSSNFQLDGKGKLFPKILATDAMEFERELVRGYLNPVLQLMRLFKEGNICMPFYYYFYNIDNNTKRVFMKKRGRLYVSAEQPKYTLEDGEIPDLQTFIQNTKLPFKESFLQLAFENFELSYEARNINLSFLSLMISLETLFNVDRQELRYRISRNIAVLLGKDKDDAKAIFDKVRGLYDKRSGLVHTGKSNIGREDLSRLRSYVRKSIKEVDKLGENKSDVLDMLNSCGFGKSPSTKNQPAQ